MTPLPAAAGVLLALNLLGATPALESPELPLLPPSANHRRTPAPRDGRESSRLQSIQGALPIGMAASGGEINLSPFPGSQTAILATVGDTVLALVTGYPAGDDSAQVGCLRSVDGGSTFAYLGQLPRLHNGDILFEAASLVVRVDPATGTATWVCLSYYNNGAGAWSYALHRSTTAGATWIGPIEITAVPALTGFPDTAQLAIDPESGRLLLAWDHYYAPEDGITTRLMTTNNLGATWSAQRVFTNGGPPSTGFDPNGNGAFVAWRGGTITSGTIHVARSTDNGLTWTRNTNIVGTIQQPLPGFGDDYEHGIPTLAVGPVDGSVVVGYASRGADLGDLYATRSTNGGVSFGAPVPLNEFPGADRSQSEPAIMARTVGGVQEFAVAWIDQHSGTGNSDATEVVVATSPDGVTWSIPAPVTDAPFHAEYRADPYPSRFGGISVAGNESRLLVAHPRTGTPAYDTDSPDAWLARLENSPNSGAFSIRSVQVEDDGCHPDNLLVAGEEGALLIEIRNESAQSAAGISAVATALSVGLEILDGEATWPALAPLQSAGSLAPIRIRLAPDYPCGEPVVLLLTGASALGPWRREVTIPTGTIESETILLAESFDAIPSGVPVGWTQSGYGGANPWAVSTTYAQSVPRSLYCRDQAFYSLSRIETPTLVVPADGDELIVTFRATWDIEEWANQRQAYDGARLMAVVDGEDHPANAFASHIEGEYGHAVFANRGSTAYQGDAVWSGNVLPNFQSIRFEFPGLAGHPVRLAFELGSDAVTGRTGIFVDDLVVTARRTGCGTCSVSGVGDGPVAMSTRLSPVWPNPMRATGVVRFSLASDTDVRVHVFDVAGRPVAALLEGRRSAGEHQVIWNGTADGTDRVASGIYFVRLTTSDARLVRRIVVAD